MNLPHVDPVELVAALLGLGNIILLVRRSIWNYAFGLLTVVLYAQVFFTAKLYSDALLQFFFFALQLYGWWAWRQAGGARRRVDVVRLTWPARAAWLLGIAITSLAWGLMMRTYTDASFPWIDAAIAMTSIAAQVMLARRLIENWLLWVAVDAVAIILFVVKGLELTAGLYLLFLILSVLGVREWARAERAAV